MRTSWGWKLLREGVVTCVAVQTAQADEGFGATRLENGRPGGLVVRPGGDLITWATGVNPYWDNPVAGRTAAVGALADAWATPSACPTRTAPRAGYPKRGAVGAQRGVGNGPLVALSRPAQLGAVSG